MKKRIIPIILALVLLLALAVPTFAAEGFDASFARVIDDANLLTDAQRTALAGRLEDLRGRLHMDVAIVTVQSLNGKSVRQYADDTYDACRYGYGSNRDGLLLLISMEDRDWYISTCGSAITAFTDAGIDYIGDQITPQLSDGDYAAAFDRFAQLCEQFVQQANTGAPYDRGNLPREPLSAVWVVIALIVGFVVAKIVVGGMKGQLRSVRAQSAAAGYVRANSLHLDRSQERFLYHTVTKTPKPKQNSSSGSSTHRSSSGTTHGGGGGKF